MSTPLKALHIVNCEMGSVTSRADYSVKFSVVTPELRASESGELIRLHGKAVSVLITPLDGADAELVEVTTEAERKTPSQRLRACLHVWWQQLGKNGSFSHFYDDQMEKLITFVKTKLQP